MSDTIVEQASRLQRIRSPLRVLFCLLSLRERMKVRGCDSRRVSVTSGSEPLGEL